MKNQKKKAYKWIILVKIAVKAIKLKIKIIQKKL